MVVARLDRRERLAVDESGATAGTLGDELLDLRAGEAALQRLARAEASGVERLTYEGGDASLFFERLAPPETVVIYGASQVAMFASWRASCVSLRPCASHMVVVFMQCADSASLYLLRADSVM